MAKTIKELRARLRKESTKVLGLRAQKGCCRIYFGGSVSNRSGITESACSDIASDFPGATYDFFEGVSCADAGKPV